MLDRLMWKMLSRQTREAIINRLRISDRQSIDKILSGKSGIPPEFLKTNSLFIHIPKAAGSSLQHALFGGRVTGHLPLWHYEHASEAFVDGAFKFSFVRNPIDRACSAYRYLRKTAAHSRDSGFAAVLNRYPSFDAFVRNWLCSENIWLQIHFCPQWSFLCDKYGDLRMDFVGRYENLERDFSLVCDRLALDATLAHRNASAQQDGHDLSPDSRRRLERIYERDLDLFGYC